MSKEGYVVIKLFSVILPITVLFCATLHLESQTTGKDSIEYNKLKRFGGTCCAISWVGFVILGLIF